MPLSTLKDMRLIIVNFTGCNKITDKGQEYLKKLFPGAYIPLYEGISLIGLKNRVCHLKKKNKLSLNLTNQINKGES